MQWWWWLSTTGTTATNNNDERQLNSGYNCSVQHWKQSRHGNSDHGIAYACGGIRLAVEWRCNNVMVMHRENDNISIAVLQSHQQLSRAIAQQQDHGEVVMETVVAMPQSWLQLLQNAEDRWGWQQSNSWQQQVAAVEAATVWASSTRKRQQYHGVVVVERLEADTENIKVPINWQQSNSLKKHQSMVTQADWEPCSITYTC